MKNMFSRALLFTAIAFLSLSFSACRLDDKGPQAKIFPQNGSINVPVNAVVEIHYTKELGMTENEMRDSLFSIHECAHDTFEYFNKAAESKTTASPSDDSKSESSDTKKESEDETKKENSTFASKLGDKISFYPQTATDSKTGTVFNYLVINPEDRKTPLKYGTTYCVEAKKTKNVKGEVIQAANSSFTTEEEVHFEFDSEIEPEFLGNELASSKFDDKGKLIKEYKDYALLHFSQPVRPDDVKKRVKICKEIPEQNIINNDCGDFNGKVVTTEIFLVEDLLTDQDIDIIPSEYNLYAAAPLEGLVPGQTYKVIFTYNNESSNEETYVGVIGGEFSVTDATAPTWPGARSLARETSPLVSNVHQLFRVGIGSYSTYSTPSSENVSANSSSYSSQN